MRNFFIKKHIVDFHKRKIYFHICGFLRFPIVAFEQIGGIERVWGDDDEKSFFYKAWKKGKRYEHGIPLSDIHAISGSFDADFARSVLPMLLRFFNNDNTDSSDSQNATNNVFHVIDGNIHYKRNYYKDFLYVFMTGFAVLLIFSGWIIITHGLLLLLFLFIFYSGWKCLTKDNFYIMKSGNDILFHLYKDNINCSIPEIKSLSISTFSSITSPRIYIFLELYNGKQYYLHKFLRGYISDVYPFLECLKNITENQIKFKIVDYHLMRFIFNDYD
jgi:hypothetical protein